MMVNFRHKNKLCDTCKNKDICKYHEGVMKEVRRISKDGTNYPLGIMFYCIHHVENKPERITKGGEPFGGTTSIC